MKDQLLQELSLLHTKVAALKMYDQENATLLRQYAQEFEGLSTKLLTFNPEKFKDISASFLKTSAQNTDTVLDVHDDTDNSAGFYDSVAHLNGSINDSIEAVNSL
jgi:hypothetical protein